MSRKEELKSELEAMRLEWGRKTDELKKIEADEDFIERVRRFSPYKYKCEIQYNGGGLYAELKDITPDDIRLATVSMGIPDVEHYGGMGNSTCEVFIKDAEDWKRVNKLLEVLAVVREVQAEGVSREHRNRPEVEARRVAAVEKLLGMLK